MPESVLSFMHSPGPWLFWIGLIMGVSALLLVEVEHQLTGQKRRELWCAFAHGIRSGLRSGLRGYFAPLHKAPWQAAWRAYRDPAGRWWSPLAAWANSIERIANGKAPSANPNGKLDEPIG